jgi:hypothetical protein
MKCSGMILPELEQHQAYLYHDLFVYAVIVDGLAFWIYWSR